MRSEIKSELVCSECGSVLEVELPKEGKTEITAHWAGDCVIRISVKPCRTCYEKGQKPLVLLREMLNQ